MRAVVVLERDGTSLAADSDEEQAWSVAGRFRAEVRPIRFSEQEREGANREVQGYLFRALTSAVRSLVITAADRLVWNGRTMNIREVRLPDGNVRFTEIVAEAGVTQ